MPDSKYRELLKGAAPHENIQWALKTPFLRPHLDSFVKSFDRIFGLAYAPAALVYYASRDRRLEANAYSRVEGLNEVPIENLPGHPMSQEVVADIQKQIDQLNLLSPEDSLKIANAIGVSYVESAMRHNDEIKRAIQGIYAAVMFESWITFEAMASDLWVSAVDNGPAYLANTVAVSKELKKVDEAITPKILRELEYDARKEFGLFLRETRRVSFQKLSDIRLTYRIAFGEPISKLFLDTNNGHIEVLAAFRNVFAHKAGKIDKEFVGRMKPFVQFRSMKKDDQIELDAVTVRLLADASAHMGIALIRFVDNFIDGHQS